MAEAQRLSSTKSPGAAMLCKRMQTDLRALERRALKEMVGLTELSTDLFKEFWDFTELVEGWLRSQEESEDNPKMEAP